MHFISCTVHYMLGILQACVVTMSPLLSVAFHCARKHLKLFFRAYSTISEEFSARVDTFM